MKTYEETVVLSKQMLDHYNRCLAVKDIRKVHDPEKIAELARIQQNEGVLYAKFADGSKLNLDMVSDGIRFHDDLVWSNRNDSEDVTFQPSYKIEDKIEVKVSGNVYKVHVKSFDTSDFSSDYVILYGDHRWDADSRQETATILIRNSIQDDTNTHIFFFDEDIGDYVAYAPCDLFVNADINV